MSARVVLLGLGILVLAVGCSNPAYVCTSSSQCVADGVDGTCQPEGYCSFPDPACDSGERFEADAGDALGGTCVSTLPSCGAIGGACCPGETPCLDNLFCDAGTCTQCATDVAFGHFHTCLLRYDGTVWCTGDNTDGELGNGAFGGLPSNTWTQARDEANTPITDATVIGTGGHQTCVRRAGDDALWCWGRNDLGQLGDGSTDRHALAERATRNTDDAPLTDIVEVGGGHDHLCGRDGGGGVWCWGEAGGGRLGNGDDVTTQDQAVEVLASAGGPAFGGATSLTVGDVHACVRTAADDLWCWGGNDRGQVGNDTIINQLVPVQLGGFKATSVAAGRFHTCATKPDGGVWCWGQGNHGRLGNGEGDGDAGTDIDEHAPVPALTSIGGPAFGGAATVAAAAVSCAVTTGGDGYCWGVNRYGQTGTGAGTFVPAPVRRVDGTPLRGVDRFDAGWNRTCAFLATGELMCWGRNSEGQLGDGTFDNIGYAKPVKLTCP